MATKEELHQLIDQIPPDQSEHVLNLCKHILSPRIVQSFNEPDNIKRCLAEVGARLQLDPSFLNQHGSMSYGFDQSGNCHFTKEWKSGNAHLRLSRLLVQSLFVITFEQITVTAEEQLHYQCRIVTESSDRMVQVTVPL